jgi:GT2 family glycosyltransferase
MLEDVSVAGQYFDEDFFAYYEDADLGWRAQLLGWECRYAPRAVAHHVRAGGDTLSSARRNRPGQIHAIKNRYLMLVKNDLVTHFLLDLPLIVINEIPRLLYILLLAPSLGKGILEFFRLLRPMLHKRRIIQERRLASPSYMRTWLIQ